MVPIANRPVLEHILHLLKENGFDEIVITTCYLPDQFVNVLGDGKAYGVSLRYSHEKEPLGTAGGVRQLADLLNDTFLVISGDCLTDFSLTQAVKWHKAAKAEATLIVTEVDDPTQYGIVSMGEGGRIQRFLEKPNASEVFSNTVNTGIYILEPSALQLIPSGVPFDFSRDLFPRMLSDQRALYAFVGDGYWSDIGSCDQYIRAQSDVLYGRVRLFSPKAEGPSALWVDPSVTVQPGAHLIAPVMIGPETVIEAGAQVGPGAVVGSQCHVMADAVVEESVVWEGSRIGQEANLSGAAVGRRSVIGRRVRLSPGTTVPHGAHVQSAEAVPSLRPNLPGGHRREKPLAKATAPPNTFR